MAEVAKTNPEIIYTEPIDIEDGITEEQCYRMATNLGLEPNTDTHQQAVECLQNLYQLFVDKDCTSIEINPLAETPQGDIVVCDAKMNFDSNAAFRQPHIFQNRDYSQEDPNEAEAQQYEMDYIGLDGNIGCMVNGAGLAMATMDLIKLHGGEPANFLDVGGGATKERVAEAFKLILSNANVTAILVNIFGGIVRCDLIAEGIIQAVKEVNVSVPVVARLEGTNVEKGKALLADSGLDIVAADDLTDAAQKVVAAVA